MNEDIIVLAVPGLAATIVFFFVWGRLAYSEWDGISASGAVLGWIPAALAAAVAGAVAFGIVIAVGFVLAMLGII